jgi:hypothetical protein
MSIKIYITEIYDPAHWPKNLLVKRDEKVDADERELKKAIKEIGNKRLQKMMMNKSGCTETAGKTISN